jgi:hypothetical protein
MNVENIIQICHPGVPALAGGMPAGAAASCRASLIPQMTFEKDSPDMPFWSPGFSRWDACRGRGILPGKPDTTDDV